LSKIKIVFINLEIFNYYYFIGTLKLLLTIHLIKINRIIFHVTLLNDFLNFIFEFIIYKRYKLIFQDFLLFNIILLND
jgi:hypothetical protein